MIKFSDIIKEEAEEDLIGIFSFYEGEQQGLGVRFLNYFEMTLKKILNNPYHTFNINNDIRRAVTKVFPYCIYYIIVENKVIVFAVLHQSRKPDKIFARIT